MPQPGPEPDVLQACSPAKINLFLEVEGRREDGYHELTTVMGRVDLCDILNFRRTDDGRIRLRLAASGEERASPVSAGFPLDGQNLIVRAAAVLQEQSGTALGADIVVAKRIPLQAGLAGGSGNAAVTLRTLNRLWNCGLDESALGELADSLGSDIRFLLTGSRIAVCTGRGNRVRPLPFCGQLHGVLMIPSSGNATAAVFRTLRTGAGQADRRHPAALLRALQEGRMQGLSGLCFNRLQHAAAELNPDVDRILKQLRHTAGNAMVTGSGSACFALTESARQARLLASRLRSRTDDQVIPFCI